MKVLSKIAIVLALLISSCKTGQQGAARVESIDNAEAFTHLFEKAISPDTSFIQINTKMKASVNSEDVNVSLKVKSYIVKDSFMVLKASKLGIPAGQIKLDKDSVQILNMINGCKITEDNNYLKEKYKIPLNYSDLEGIFMGKASIIKTNLVATHFMDTAIVFSNTTVEQAQVLLDTAKTGEITPGSRVVVIDTASTNVQMIAFEEQGFQGLITYDEYETLDSVVIPKLFTMRILSPENKVFMITFEINKWDAEDKKVSFTIPKSYENCSQ